MKKFLIRQYNNRNLYIKYFISGLSAAMVHIALLSFFYRFIGLHIIVSTSLGFVVAFFVSFYLQKFWTFKDDGREKMIKQMSLYLFTALSNMAINAAAMYFLVEKFGVWYLLAQVLMSGTIAIESFLVYKLIIFNKKDAKRVNNNEDINPKK